MKKASFKKWLINAVDLSPEQKRQVIGLLSSTDEQLSTDDGEALDDNRRTGRAVKYREILRIMAEESEYVRKILDLSSDMIISSDSDRGINVFNIAAEKVFGYNIDEVRGRKVETLYGNHEESHFVLKQMQEKGSFSGEVSGRRKNGEIFPMRITASFIHDSAGNRVGSVGYSRDLTRERRAEEIERQYTALRELEQLRQDVEYIIQHDLKSPLNSVIGFSDILAHDARIDDDQKELLFNINKSGIKLLRMINQSLDIFKMTQGSYLFEPKPVDILPILAEIQQDLLVASQDKKIIWKIHIDGRDVEKSDRFAVAGEAPLCYNMLVNLLKNAVEASPRDHAVTVTMHNSPKAVIEIHNFGAVPAEIRDNFFDKYITQGKKSGTGLGTYSARLMAETQGGTILMNSSEAQGTTLRIEMLNASPM